MSTAKFPGRYKSLAKISDFVMKAARKAELDDSAIYAVQLAVDEACSNIIEHAYGGEGSGEIQCTCTASRNGLTVILRDQGHPFNPDNVPEPRFDVSITDLKPGGAGLFLMRKLMDEVYFDFSPESGNTLTMIKHKGGKSPK
jgi:serine/threonine-protein kinase RsbW